MSSHHFVKEGQEPSLLIVNPISFQVVAPLLEWAPLVVVSEDGLDNMLDWGIKVDIVFVKDENYTIIQDRIALQAPVEIKVYQYDFLSKALTYLIQKNQQAVNIIATNPDEHFEELKSFNPLLQINIISENIKWSLIRHGQFQKWLSSEMVIFTDNVQPKSIDNLKNNEDQSFTVISDGIATIRCLESFWIGESLKI